MNSYPNVAYNPHIYKAPMRENNSLKVEDIPGAKPRVGPGTKYTHHYENKISSHYDPYEGQPMPNQQPPYYTKPQERSKRHYNVHHNSEIARLGGLIGIEDLPATVHNVEFPRNLSTSDIPGTKPGSLISKTVKNHDLAPKLREEYEQTTKGKSMSPQRSEKPADDALDKFQREQYYMQASEPYTRNSVPVQSNSGSGNMNFHYAQHLQNSSIRSNIKDEISPREMNLNNSHAREMNLSNSQARDMNLSNSHIQQNPHAGHIHKGDLYPEEDYHYSQNQRAMPKSNPQEDAYYQESQSNKSYDIKQQSYEASRYAEPIKERSYEEDRYEPSYRERTQPNEAPYYPNNPNQPSLHMLDRKEHLEQSNYSIIAKQKALEQKITNLNRGRAFNIISNGAMPRYGSEAGRQHAYGTNIKAMKMNQEDTLRGYAPSKQVPGSMAPYSGSYVNQEVRRKEIDPVDIAGKMSDYAETNYRYANKVPQQKPLAEDQYFGSRALKNLSGLKLY